MYPPVVQRIIDLLEKEHVWFETFQHEPVITSEEAAKIRSGYSLKQGAKAMIVRVKEKGEAKYFAMLVLPGDQRFSNDKVKSVFNAKDIRFATEEEVKDITEGVEPGGVPPFGNLFGLRLVVDQTLFNNEKIVFNAGDRRFSIAMRSQDYAKIVKPELESII
jgi:prolyl-tRNA editing enzyme YbaK/EbsC (Cys-tRNA(Pro) deacylase)